MKIDERGMNVAVLGSTGFAGQELVGILEEHPAVDTIQKPNRESLPEFEGSDVVFLALLHGQSGKEAARFRKLGSTVIDLSGDLRFPTAEAYEKWYGSPHPAPDLLPVPYGLPERYRDKLMERPPLVSMPGCYPTATLLSLLPLIEHDLIRPDLTVTIDADSGVSGSGKTPTELTHFMNMSGNAFPYKTGRQHPHVGEIELFLEGRKIFFSPSVIPIERGMLVKSTTQLSEGVTGSDVQEVLEKTYKTEPFIQVLPEGHLPNIKETARTNECHIGAVVAQQTVQLGSSIDNLRKGAASQAVQVFNLIFGFPETTGLVTTRHTS